jgi:hypothetical protein
MNDNQISWLKNLVNSAVHSAIWAAIMKMPLAVQLSIAGIGSLLMLYWMR